MNGLKYIRIRCNLSLNELATIIGVTRQALSAWENGKKEIPGPRKEQLSQFFGIEQSYFGDITEEEKKYLLEKALFRYVEDGKEFYRYKPQQSLEEKSYVPIYFFNDSEMSLDEQYVASQRKRQEMLDKVDEIIRWTRGTGSLHDQMACINRGCEVYGMLTELMENMRRQKPMLRMPFYYEVVSVLKAMLIAYGMLDLESIKDIYGDEGHCGTDVDWINQMATSIREHWEKEYAHFDEIIKQHKMRKSIEIPSVREQIMDVEEDNRKRREMYPEQFLC